MGEKLRVLSIGHSYVIAGNRAILRETAQDPDFDVTVAAPKFFFGDLRPVTLEPEPAGSPLKVVGVSAHRTKHIHVFGYSFSELRALVAQGNFDVVHAWEEPYILAGYQIARALGPVSARFCFRTAQSLKKWYPPPFGFFERAVRRRAQGWIAGGNLVYQAMLSRGYLPEEGRVLTLAVDQKAFRPLDPAARQSVWQELGITGPVVGFLGRLTAAKGIDVLLRAMEIVGGAEPWSLFFMGSGPYEPIIRQWALRHGWQDRVCVRLIDHAEVPRYLGAMDLMAAPSQTTKNWKEQFGRMVVEGFASGVPVLGSDSGEIPHVIGPAGVVIPEKDPIAWARAILECLKNSETRERYRELGLKRAEIYSAASIGEQYRAYYRWLASRPLARR